MHKAIKRYFSRYCEIYPDYFHNNVKKWRAHQGIVVRKRRSQVPVRIAAIVERGLYRDDRRFSYRYGIFLCWIYKV